METKTILENNRLIAEFMGAKYDKDTSFPIHHNDLWLPTYGICNCTTIDFGMGKILNFHASWDWLMPCVEKINNELHGRPEIRIGFRTEVIYSPLSKDGETVQNLFKNYPDGSINSVYKAVVQFINWYNDSKNQTQP
jgi:hypothetical protein